MPWWRSCDESREGQSVIAEPGGWSAGHPRRRSLRAMQRDRGDAWCGEGGENLEAYGVHGDRVDAIELSRADGGAPRERAPRSGGTSEHAVVRHVLTLGDRFPQTDHVDALWRHELELDPRGGIRRRSARRC